MNPPHFSLRSTKRYRRDLKRLKKSGYDLQKIEEVVGILIAGKQIPENYKNHKLKGKFLGIEECHIEPDWLLMYQRDQSELILVLIRTGTHNDLFDE